MAVVNATVLSVRTIEGGAFNPDLQVAEITFALSGTYAQADNAAISGAAAAIQNSRRNGKTVALKNAMLKQPARKASDNSTIMAAKTVTVAGNDVTFEVTDGDWTTELAGGAVPAQGSYVFSMLVGFTES